MFSDQRNDGWSYFPLDTTLSAGEDYVYNNPVYYGHQGHDYGEVM